MQSAGALTFLAFSATIWLSFLLAMQSVLLTFLGLIVATLALLVTGSHEATPSAQCVVWLSLLIPAVAAWTRSGSRRSLALSVGTASILMAAASVAQYVMSRWIAVSTALVLWLLLAAFGGSLYRLLERCRHSGRYTDDSLRVSYDHLRSLSAPSLHEKVSRVLRALREHPDGLSLPDNLAQLANLSIGETWIITTLLLDEEMVRLRNSGASNGSVASITAEGHRWLKESASNHALPESALPSLTIVGDVILAQGGKVMTGDTYNVSGGNVTGAFGRNKVGSISASASGQAVNQQTVAGAARALAASLPADTGSELHSAADELEDAKEPNALRRAIHRVIGIAALLGEEGRPLLDLARRLLESVIS